MKENDVRLSRATLADIAEIAETGRAIWREHYPGIISSEQIEYMLARRYTPESLRFQLEQQGHRYLLARRGAENALCGFISFSNTTAEGDSYLYVHRLYLLASRQGLGIGRVLMDGAVAFAEAHGHVRLRLCVHRDNPSKYFYLKYGFRILKEVNTPYGPYELNDYVMEYKIA